MTGRTDVTTPHDLVAERADGSAATAALGAILIDVLRDLRESRDLAESYRVSLQVALGMLRERERRIRSQDETIARLRDEFRKLRPARTQRAA